MPTNTTAQVATIMYFSSIGVIYFNQLSCLFQRIELLTSASDQGAVVVVVVVVVVRISTNTRSNSSF